MKKSVCVIIFCFMTILSFAKRPNVIVLYTDDQKMDQFGFINGKAHTPNIDRLAREGAYFSNAYASSSVCSPSRYSCLTGQYASRCTSKHFKSNISKEGMTKVLWNMGIGQKEWCFPKVLQKNGYRTGMVGKWHVGLSNRHGKRKQVKGTDPADPAVKAVLRHNQELTCRDIADNGFDYVGGAYAGNPNDDRNLIKVGCNVHAVEWTVKHALDFIETRSDKPFMLYFAPTLLHSPSPLASLKGDPRLSPLGLLDKPIEGVMPTREDVLRRAKAAGIKDKRCIPATWLDDVVGVLQKKLKDLGVLDNTVIIYFNDNGTDDQGKGSCYQGGAHVPMIVWRPGAVKAGEYKNLTGNIDIAPTVFDMCGIQAPADMHLDGASLLPVVRGENPEWRESLYLEIGLTRAVVSDGFKYLAFRVPESYINRPLENRLAKHKRCMEKIYERHPWTKKNWKIDPEAKYLQMGMAPGGDFMERLQIQGKPPFANNYFDPDQLYDLNKDPRETTNLATNPEYAAKLARMKKKLKLLLRDVPGTFAELKAAR